MSLEYRVQYAKSGGAYLALHSEDRWMATVKYGHREWILTDSSEARVRRRVKDFIASRHIGDPA